MTPLRRLRGRLITAILSISLCGATEAQPNDELIMSWAGPSEMGFLRVELRTPDPKDPGISRLVIKCATLAGITTHTGQLVLLPIDIRTDPSVSHLFVASSADMAKHARYGPTVVGSMAHAGTFRLYVLGPCDLRTPPTLKPLGGAE